MLMGIPKILTTDQGSEFKNNLNDDDKAPWYQASVATKIGTMWSVHIFLAIYLKKKVVAVHHD